MAEPRRKKYATSFRLALATQYYLPEIARRQSNSQQAIIDRLVYEEARRLGIPPPPEDQTDGRKTE